MIARWFFATFPPSRSVVESELRQAIWRAGLQDLWLTCTRDQPPFECQGEWHAKPFTLQWDPGTYIFLKMPEPNQELLDAFEKVLGHRALAAYKNGDNQVVVEWRIKDADARFNELQGSAVSNLERLHT